MGSPFRLKLYQHRDVLPDAKATEIVRIEPDDVRLLPTLAAAVDETGPDHEIELDNPGGIYRGETIYRLLGILRAGTHMQKAEVLEQVYTIRGLVDLLAHASFLQVEALLKPLQDALNAKISKSSKKRLRDNFKLRLKTPQQKPRSSGTPYQLLLGKQHPAE